MAFTRAGRPAGHSSVWTPPVPQKCRAPHTFRSSLRAPLHARETRSTVCAGRTAGCGLLYVRLDRVSRAYGLGRRGVAPRLAADAWARLWSAGAASANRLPPSPPSTGIGPVRFRGQRAAMPLPHVRPAADVAPLRCSAVAQRLRACGLLSSWRGLSPDRTSGRITKCDATASLDAKVALSAS